MIATLNDRQVLLIRQPYLEGMMPYEYQAIIETIEKLGVANVNVYFEASSITQSDEEEVHRISTYFNKRFYKLTPKYSHKLINHNHSGSKKLFISEGGSTLPSKTELKFAEKAKFDLYTITNFSFMDLA